jgi:hypothetical protein
MPEYLATGRDPSGKKVTERIDADSADEAVQALCDRGYDEIVLHTDDVAARYTRQSAVASVITPREYLWYRHMPPKVAGFLIVAIKGYQRGWIWYLGALALLAYRHWQGLRWGALDVALVIYLLFPALFALAAQLIQGAGGRYRRLIEAVSWGRWDEVLEQADSVGGGVPPEETAFRKAAALAGLGRLTEGLEMVKPFGDGVSMPPWLYWSRLAGVYATAKRHEDARAAMEKALELDPENVTLLVDRANTEVWRWRNLRLAR